MVENTSRATGTVASASTSGAGGKSATGRLATLNTDRPEVTVTHWSASVSSTGASSSSRQISNSLRAERVTPPGSSTSPS
jgi:hypothetical protein